MDLAVPETVYTIVKDDAGTDGYSYGRPPGIEGVHWPRSRCTGLPMAHLFTIRVPEQYRCAGRDLVGLSVFQADDHVAVRIPGVAEVIAGGEPPTHDQTAARYWAAVVEYGQHRHPRERYREDLIFGGWVWIWLTEAELAAAPCPLPDPAATVPGHPGFRGEWPADRGMVAWEKELPAVPLRLVPRTDDPNVGKAIEDDDLSELAESIAGGWEPPAGYVHSGYIPMFSAEGERLGLSDRFFGESHFGGTAEYQNGGEPFPRLGPWYIAFDDGICGVNVAGNSARIDLPTDRIEWSS